jgi:hypothetical protein
MAIHYLVRGQREPLITKDLLPPNLRPSVKQWVAQRLWTDTPYGVQLEVDIIRDAERRLGVAVPFDPTSEEAAVADILERVERSENFAVQLLTILLESCGEVAIYELQNIFDAPGSKWEVVHDEEAQIGWLVSRSTGPRVEVVEALASLSEPAHDHLVTALKKLAGPSPEPAVAYFHAVKAVEAAAHLTVLPDDPKATLGKMIRAMENKPSKWAVVLDSEEVEDVIRRMVILWNQPHERHGSSAPDPPVTLDQAHAGFALALGLVDHFARRLIYRVDQDKVAPL